MNIDKLSLKKSKSAIDRVFKRNAKVPSVRDLLIPAGVTSSDRLEKVKRSVYF